MNTLEVQLSRQRINKSKSWARRPFDDRAPLFHRLADAAAVKVTAKGSHVNTIIAINHRMATSVASYVEKLLAEHLTAKGYLAEHPESAPKRGHGR